MLSLSFKMLPQRQGTSPLPSFALTQQLFPTMQSRHDGEEHVQQIYKNFKLLLRTESYTGLPAAIKGNAYSKATREDNPRFVSSLSQCNKSRVT